MPGIEHVKHIHNPFRKYSDVFLGRFGAKCILKCLVESVFFSSLDFLTAKTAKETIAWSFIEMSVEIACRCEFFHICGDTLSLSLIIIVKSVSFGYDEYGILDYNSELF